MSKEVRVSAFPSFDYDGNVLEVVLVVRDITEQKSFENQMRTSYRMASLGRLTAGVFHEILNPVNIISSHIQLMLMEAEKDSNTAKDLESIKEEIDRIVNITDSLLRFSRKEKSKTGDVNINDVLKRLIHIVEPELKLKSIKIIKKFDMLPQVTANSSELRQVFLNLTTNARDAMPEGGTITISTKLVKNGTFNEKPIIRIEFTDTGAGIGENDIEYIFDPFFTTKEEGKGTGLGLSESFNIIENHGGLLHVKSERGEGSTFIVDLPTMD